MDLLLTRAGMLLCSTCIIFLIVYLCLKSHFFSALTESVALVIVMFGGLALGLYGAAVLGNPVAVIIGALISLPSACIGLPRLKQILKRSPKT